MRVGVAAETKVAEGRVALTPAGTRELTARGHEVLVQSGAGAGLATIAAHSVTAMRLSNEIGEDRVKRRPALCICTSHVTRKP